MQQPLITSVGEALVDFVSTDIGPLEHSSAFLPRLGGEAANVAVGLAKTGVRSAFVGRVGGDAFGRFIIAELKRYGVDTSGVKIDRHHRTRLAFVSRTQTGDRDFAFWENSPAGAHLTVRDIPRSKLMESTLLNIGPLLLLREPSRSTALQLAQTAVRRHLPVAFDVNLRISLWHSRSEARQVIFGLIRLSSIVRLNKEEAHFLTGATQLSDAAARLRARGPLIVVITLGERGCFVQTPRVEASFDAPSVQPVDTTGCGDAFFAGLLRCIALHGGSLLDIDQTSWAEFCRYANVCGALTACRHGAADAIPNAFEIEQFLREHQTKRAIP